MDKNTKFNLGDVVYFVGEYEIYQAIIIEVRCIERYTNGISHINPFVKESLELYRLGEYKTDKSGFINNNDKYTPDYKGEFDMPVWFTSDILFNTAEEACKSINIRYINDKDNIHEEDII